MKDITNYLEKPRVDVMLEAAACSTRDYLLIRILRRGGIRVDELLHIRPVDLEHYTNTVRIVKAKGNKQRRVPRIPGHWPSCRLTLMLMQYLRKPLYSP